MSLFSSLFASPCVGGGSPPPLSGLCVCVVVVDDCVIIRGSPSEGNFPPLRLLFFYCIDASVIAVDHGLRVLLCQVAQK